MSRSLVYAAGAFGFAYTSTVFTQWIYFRHAQAAPLLLALVLGAKPLLEAIASPLVGAWTDRRGGAALRKKILVLGSLPLALVFAGLWSADSLALLLVPIFGLATTCVCQPYNALITSVSRTPDERNRNALASAGLAFVGTGAALALGPKLAGSDAFGTLALSGALALALFVFVPALFLDAAPAPEPSTPATEGGSLGVIGHPGMPLYLAGNALLASGGVALMAAAPFVVKAALGAPPEALVPLNLALVAGVVVAALVMTSLARHVTPGKILAASGVAGALVALGAASGMGGSYALFALGFGVLGVTLFASVAAPPLILARFAEEDGRRREGAFFGLSGLATNVGNGAGLAVTSLLMAPLGVRGLLVVSGLAMLAGGVLQGLVRSGAAEAPAEPVLSPS